MGFVPLLFALAGWALGRDPRRRFVTWSGWILLALSFGSLTPLFALVYLAFPPLSLVRFPVKLLTLVVLMIALLAGWGVDALKDLCGAKTTKANPGDTADCLAQRARRSLLYPLLTIVAAVLAIWVISLVGPSLVAACGSWILVHTNAFLRPGEAYRLTPSEVGDAARYLVVHVRLEFTVLIGLGFGAAVWIGVLLLGRSSRRLGKASLAIIAILGLCQVALENYYTNPTVPNTFYTYRPPLLDRVSAASQPYRFCHVLHKKNVVSAGYSDVREFLNFDSIPGAERFSAESRGSFRNRLTLRGGSLLTDTDTVLNNDVDLSFPPYLFEFWYFAIRQAPTQAQADCLIGRTNVRYLISTESEPNASTRLIGPVFDGSAKPASLYQNLCFLPRAFVARSALNGENSFDTLSRLSAPDFDPYDQVILAQDPGGQATPEAGLGRSAVSGVSEPVAGIGEIRALEEQPNRVSLNARLARPGYVVLLDRFDPNWHATVDGREVPIYRANQLFRAVRVETGEHVVRFEYRQKGLLAGLVISVTALMSIVVIWFRESSLRRRVT